MDLSIITVTWNSEELIAKQIKSVVKACKHISYEHFIVDNASVDKTVEVIEKNFPHIILIKNSSNCGLAAANNMAAQKAQGKFVLLLNPDMRLFEGSLDIFLAWMMKQHPDVGIAGPKLVTGKFNVRSIHKPTKFPTGISLALTALKVSVLFPRILDRYSYSDQELKQDIVVDAVRGSFLLMKREVYTQLGFVFDPRYFLWFEDVDICREAKRLGYKVMFTPVIFCVDYAGQSFKKLNWLKRQRQFFKSACIYLKKWEPRYKSIIVWTLSWVGLGMVWLYAKAGGTKFKNAIER